MVVNLEDDFHFFADGPHFVPCSVNVVDRNGVREEADVRPFSFAKVGSMNIPVALESRRAILEHTSLVWGDCICTLTSVACLGSSERRQMVGGRLWVLSALVGMLSDSSFSLLEGSMSFPIPYVHFLRTVNLLVRQDVSFTADFSENLAEQAPSIQEQGVESGTASVALLR